MHENIKDMLYYSHMTLLCKFKHTCCSSVWVMLRFFWFETNHNTAINWGWVCLGFDTLRSREVRGGILVGSHTFTSSWVRPESESSSSYENKNERDITPKTTLKSSPFRSTTFQPWCSENEYEFTSDCPFSD